MNDSRTRQRTQSTHFIPYDAIAIGRNARALCGELVDRRAHAAEPTCEACAEQLLCDAHDLDELREMTDDLR